MPARQEGVVLRNRGVCRNLRVDGVDRTEQVDRRVDHVAEEIEQDAAAISGRRILAPPVLGRGPPTFPTELMPEDFTERTRLHGLSCGDVLGVESAVLEDCESHTGRAGRLD